MPNHETHDCSDISRCHSSIPHRCSVGEVDADIPAVTVTPNMAAEEYTDSSSSALDVRTLERLLHLSKSVAFPVLDRWPVGQVIPSLVDFQTVMLKVVMELIEEERSGDVTALVSSLVGACSCMRGQLRGEGKTAEDSQSSTTAE